MTNPYTVGLCFWCSKTDILTDDGADENIICVEYISLFRAKYTGISLGSVSVSVSSELHSLGQVS